MERAAGIGGTAAVLAQGGPRREEADGGVENRLGDVADPGQDLDPWRDVAHRGLGRDRGHRRGRLGLAPTAISGIVRPVVTEVW